MGGPHLGRGAGSRPERFEGAPRRQMEFRPARRRKLCDADRARSPLARLPRGRRFRRRAWRRREGPDDPHGGRASRDRRRGAGRAGARYRLRGWPLPVDRVNEAAIRRVLAAGLGGDNPAARGRLRPPGRQHLLRAAADQTDRRALGSPAGGRTDRDHDADRLRARDFFSSCRSPISSRTGGSCSSASRSARSRSRPPPSRPRDRPFSPAPAPSASARSRCRSWSRFRRICARGDARPGRRRRGERADDRRHGRAAGASFIASSRPGARFSSPPPRR